MNVINIRYLCPAVAMVAWHHHAAPPPSPEAAAVVMAPARGDDWDPSLQSTAEIARKVSMPIHNTGFLGAMNNVTKSNC